MGRQKKEYLHSKIMTGVDLHSKTSYQKKYSEHGKKVINKKLLEIAKQHKSGNVIKITPDTHEYEKNKNNEIDVSNANVHDVINDDKEIDSDLIDSDLIPTNVPISRAKNKNIFYTGSEISNVAAMKNRFKNTVSRQNDSGSTAIVTGLTTAEVIYASIKAGQKIESAVAKTTQSSVQTGVKILNKVDYAAWQVKTGTIKLNKETFQRFKTLAKYNVSNLPVIWKVRYAVAKTQYVYSSVKYAGVKTVSVVRGITTGQIKIKLDGETVKSLGKQGAGLLGKGMKKGVAATVKVPKKLMPPIKKTIVKSADVISLSEDDSLRMAGDIVKGAGYAKSFVRTTAKTTRKVAHGTIKTGKAAYRTGRKINRFAVDARQYGLNSAMQMRKAKMQAEINKAGKSVVSALQKVIYRTITKALIPVIIVAIILVSFANTIVISGASAYQVLFGWISTDKDTGDEIDEQQWLQQKIAESRVSLVEKVKTTKNKNLKSGGGDYDIVRFYNALTDTEVELTDENVLACIYSESQYLLYIQPLFHTILLSNYDLEATQAEMSNVYNGIMGKLTKINTSELPVEWCFAGEREPDNNIHADIDSCPNHSDIYYHNDDDNEFCSCDYAYYICEGHKGELNCDKDEHEHTDKCYNNSQVSLCNKEEHTHNDDCYTTKTKLDWINGHLKIVQYDELTCGKEEHTHSDDCFLNESNLICGKEEHVHNEWNNKDDAGCYTTNYCSDEKMTEPCENSSNHKGCNGYYICQGHRVMKLTITCGSFDDLLEDYFLLQIEDLEQKESLTEDEQEKLETLKENYELCTEYISNLREELGGEGNGNIIDIGNVPLTDVTEYACGFVGKPYVWGGTDPNVGADCSGFVQYVYNHFGITLPRTAAQQAQVGVEITLAEAQPGDLIFYADDGVRVSHVAMYIGDGKIVHASNPAPYPQGGIKISNVYGTPCKITRVAQ